MNTLKLEIRSETDRTGMIEAQGGGMIMMAPMVAEDYWSYRVKLGENGQAIVGFPKFGMIGVGFAQEEDWNTNLPTQTDAQTIFDHIIHNKGDDSIPDEDVLRAIKMVQAAHAELT